MRAVATGASGYITKQFDFDSLTRSIKTVPGLELAPPPKA
jgi:DNA-binding NarL/FixJ family response regulator